METQVWLMTKISKIEGNFQCHQLGVNLEVSLVSVCQPKDSEIDTSCSLPSPPIEALLSLEAILIDSHRGDDIYFLSTHLFHYPVRAPEPNKLTQLDNVQIS
jgi:hypothetical protein